jgi:hypothetical protein
MTKDRSDTSPKDQSSDQPVEIERSQVDDSLYPTFSHPVSFGIEENSFKKWEKVA